MSCQNPEVSALIESLRQSLPQRGPDGSYNREQLKETAERLSIALETPGETCQRVAYYPLRTTIVRIANRLNILNILIERNGPLSVKELSRLVGADHLLLTRLMRFLAAIYVISEAGVGSYVATMITRHLAVSNLEAGVNHTYDLVCTAVMQLDPFLVRTKYQNPTDPRHCPFQDGFRTEDILFEWLPKHPEYLNNYNLFMSGHRVGRANWLDFFPLEEQIATAFDGGKDGILWVDIGGGRGHEVEAIKERYPYLPGRFILQDLPDTIKQALPVPGMETMNHNFFMEQPIKGARAYYMRNILHDWPDDKCLIILSQLKASMKPGYSKIIINEMVLPDTGITLTAAQLDITMMCAHAAAERTEGQWRQMIDSAGLMIEKIWTKVQEDESILVLVPKPESNGV